MIEVLGERVVEGNSAVNYFSGKCRRPTPWSLPADDPRERLMLGCALAGLGSIQVPGLSVERYLASGELVQVLPTMADVRWPLSAMYPHRQYLAPQGSVRIVLQIRREGGGHGRLVMFNVTVSREGTPP
jgi:LysR family transcriptional regulator for bpeEF and oprC